ncbi:MAG: ATPase [Proteobacteria bacterium]|nr:ATPase [Pseudomonadota bacterium]
MPNSSPIKKAAAQVSDDRPSMATFVLKYADTDLLCYRADHPTELRERQQQAWQPLLDWAATTFQARLLVTKGISPVDQPAEALSHLQSAVEALDDRALAALAVLTQACGSLIIGLAVIKGHLDAEQAMLASQLDERWQTQKWGEDEDDRKRRDGLKGEIQAAIDFLKLVPS